MELIDVERAVKQVIGKVPSGKAPVIDLTDEIAEQSEDSGIGREESPLANHEHEHYNVQNQEQNTITSLNNSEQVDEDRDADTTPIPDGQYEVEEIIDYSRDRTGELYLVKWLGWDPEHNTWEPPSSLFNCQDALMAFFIKRTNEIKELTNQRLDKADYISNESGTKRRKGSHLSLTLPPDPSPLSARAKTFYEVTRFPTPEETKELELLWKTDFQRSKSVSSGKSKKPGPSLTRWHRIKLDQFLTAATKGQQMTVEEDIDLRKQLFLQERDELRQIATEDLKDWEEELNGISKGKPKLTVENTEDWEGPPKEFTYINDYLPTGDIIIPNDPIVGCSCIDCYFDKKNCCPGQFHSHFAYTPHKKVRVMPGTPIYECNSKCECGFDCPNRVVQDGRVNISHLSLCIFRTSNGRGWGVKTLKKICKNTFVSLYLGEVITSEEAERRGKEYDRSGCTYLFDLDINDGKEANRYTIDATKFGNISHFINHSCDPNLAVFSVFVNCLDPDLPKLALFATRDIARGEELSFDYENQVTADPEPHETRLMQQPCLCESANCRKYLF